MEQKQPKLEGRIRFSEGRDGEWYKFELKWSNESEDEWGLETAYRIVDDMIPYGALTHIREWMKKGISFHFA